VPLCLSCTSKGLLQKQRFLAQEKVAVEWDGLKPTKAKAKANFFLLLV
jgi:hypothetical protein